MKISEMYSQVHEYCKILILDSKKEDWVNDIPIQNNRIIHDNIVIRINNIRFCVEIFESKFNIGTSNKELYTFYIDVDWFFYIDKQKKALRSKFKEINEFLKNKEEYEKATTIYNLLPIKELRKKKLKNIDNDSIM